MPRSGGVYTPPSSSDYPAVIDTTIDPDDHNATLLDIATALTGSLPVDGSAPMTNNLPMGSHKLTGLAAGSTSGDSVRYEQWIAGRAIDTAIATTGSANAYVLTTGLSLAALADGQVFFIKPNFTNTNTATIAVDGLTAKALTKNGTTALASGDIVSGTEYVIAYDGTQFQVLGVLPGIYQLLDATLTALAALTITANTHIRGTGTDAFSVDSFTAVSQTLVAQTTQAALRSTGLGSSTVGDAVFVAADAATARAAISSSAYAQPYTNLKVLVTSDTAATISADVMTMWNNSGDALRATSFSKSLATGTSGAGGMDTGSIASSTWYYVHVIAKADGTLNVVMSLSATAPTMPSGYTFALRVGAIRSNGSSHLYRTIQYGRETQVPVGVNPSALSSLVIASGSATSTPAWANFAPPTAAALHASVLQATGGTVAQLGPSANNYAASAIGTNITVPIRFIPESANVAYNSNGAGGSAVIFGWTDNI